MVEAINKDVHEKLAKALGGLAEGILTEKDPYKMMPFQAEASSYIYTKYRQYKNELEKELRNKIINEEVDYAKYEFLDALVGMDKSFAELYPQHMETKKVFSNWVKEKEGFNPNSFIAGASQTLSKNIPISNTVKNCIKERLPEFSYESNAFSGFISFSKAFIENNKIYIAVDKGTKRKFLSFFVGIEDPKVCFDIANFFGNAQSKYKYQSLEELEVETSKAIDLVSAFLPHFEKTLSEVI